MTTWYKANCGSYPEIKEIEVIKETDKQVVVQWTDSRGNVHENRRHKVSDYEGYFPTYKEARQYVIDTSVSAWRDHARKADYYKEIMEKTLRQFPSQESKP